MDQEAAKSDVRFAAWRALRTLVLGGAIVLVLVLPKIVLPADFFLTVDELTICPRGVQTDKCAGFDHNVIRKTLSPRWPMRMHRFATIYRIHVFPVNGENKREILDAICRGGGEWLYNPADRPQFIDLNVWIGGPCTLQPAARYVAYEQWTIRWGIWTWTVTKLGEPALVPA